MSVMEFIFPRLKKSNDKKKTAKKVARRGKSPGALGGRVRSKSPGALGGKAKTSQLLPKAKPKSKTKSKVKATAANTKNYASTLAMQKRLIKMGANIKADGLMGPKTRAAIKKYIKNPSTLKKKKIDPFAIKGTKKKPNAKSRFTEPVDRKTSTKKKKNVMSTKDKKFFPGTNITPTKLQRDRMRKRKMAST